MRKTVLEKRPFVPAHEKTLEKSPSESLDTTTENIHAGTETNIACVQAVWLARPVQVFAQYPPSLSFCNITAGFTLHFIALSQ